MRGTFCEGLEDLEADDAAGFTALTLEVRVSERVSAAGLKVSSMVAAPGSRAGEEDED